MATSVYKQLATKQDLTFGNGKVVQRRNGSDVELDLIDFDQRFKTTTAAITSLFLYEGATVALDDRGGVWDVTLASTVIVNGYNIIQCTGLTTLALVLRVNSVMKTSWFGVNSSLPDIAPAVQAAVDLCISSSSKLILDIPAAGATQLTGVDITGYIDFEHIGGIIRCTGNVIFYDFNLPFPNAKGTVEFKGLRLENTAGYNKLNAGTGVAFRNLVAANVSNFSMVAFTQGFSFYDEFFNNVFTRCRTLNGPIGWEDALASSNNNNTFINCRFSGALAGSRWDQFAIDQVFVGCDFSSVNEDQGTLPDAPLNRWLEAVSVKFFGGYIEGAAAGAGYIINGFEFSSTLSSNGHVIFDGFWFKGSSDKLGTAVTVNANIECTMTNPWFNGFDKCFEANGSGEHYITNYKQSVINSVLDFSSFTGTAIVNNAGKTDHYNGNVVTASIVGSTGSINGEKLLLSQSISITSGSGDPEGVVTGVIGDIYIRNNATAGRSNQLHIKTTASGNTGWERNTQFKRGSTANRPTGLFSSDIGLQYFDTDLGTVGLWIYYAASTSTTDWKLLSSDADA